MHKGRGYFLEQATQPQTIGYSLADSPVGLLAWVYEKLVAWSDNYTWDDDEGELVASELWTGRGSKAGIVLTWISVYWLSRPGPAASVRIYYEVANASEYTNVPWSSIPCGMSFFPKELGLPPKT